MSQEVFRNTRHEDCYNVFFSSCETTTMMSNEIIYRGVKKWNQKQ